MKIGERYSAEIATAGRPVEAVAAAARRLAEEPGISIELSVAHDEGCPCTSGSSMARCTCEIVTLEGKRTA